MAPPFCLIYQQVISYNMYKDPGIENLLALDGQIVDQHHGYWVKIEARRVEPTAEIPHGIRYSLTLHEPYGKRILGYLNFVVDNNTKFHSHSEFADRGVPIGFFVRGRFIDRVRVDACPVGHDIRPDFIERDFPKSRQPLKKSPC